eukprot:03066.XXX_37121_37270_1 [CDS] Oithona nana genome sequencing.
MNFRAKNRFSLQRQFFKNMFRAKNRHFRFQVNIARFAHSLHNVIKMRLC